MAGEIYTPVRSIEIPSKTLGKIGNARVNGTSTPFKEGYIPYLSVASVNGDFAKIDDSKAKLKRLTPYHQRSHELSSGQKDIVFFSDEYGNIYSSLSLKGNNFEDPHAYYSSAAPGNVLIYGLVESDVTERVIRASEVLRRAGVDTEIIVKIMEPKLFPYKGELIGLEEFQKRLAEDAKNVAGEKNTLDPNRSFYRFKFSQIPNLYKVLKNRTFYGVVRGLKISHRITDFEGVDKKDITEFLRRIFDIINHIEQIEAEANDSRPEHFDFENREDINRYFLDYLPRKIATNLSKMHKAGVYHWYPHLGNVTATGGFPDLDSARGKPIDPQDKPITMSKIDRDLNFILLYKGNNVSSLLKSLEEKGIVKNARSASNQFAGNFLRHYFYQMGWEQDIAKHIEFISRYFDYFNGLGAAENEDHLVHYSHLLRETFGYRNFRIKITKDSLVKFKAQETRRIRTILKNIEEDGAVDIKAVSSELQCDFMEEFFNFKGEDSTLKQILIRKYSDTTLVKTIMEIMNDYEYNRCELLFKSPLWKSYEAEMLAELKKREKKK